MTPGKGYILVQLGSPKSPDVADVREFLKNFLGDPRVVDYKSVFWKILLYGYILPLRPKQSAKAYQRIWDGESFPLLKYTESFSKNLQEYDKSEGLNNHIKHAYIIGQPSIRQRIDELVAAGCESICFVYQFPQYAEATTLSADDAVEEALKSCQQRPAQVEKIQTFHNDLAYTNNTAASIDRELQEFQADKLVLSFHGYPLRRIFAGDDYFKHCCESAQLIASKLKHIEKENIVIAFQSQFGREEWLTPSTRDTLLDFAKSGVEKVAVACPSFTVDNLETLEEIDIGLREEFIEAGGKEFKTLACLNDQPSWVEDFHKDILCAKTSERNIEEVVEKSIKEPVQEWKSPPLSDESKVSLKIMFKILFLDLVGFAIIFPLFPRMLEYYGSVEGENSLFHSFMNFITYLRDQIGGSGTNLDIVLFGGVLGSLYSLLQFLFAPVWGSLSDKYGRKPILVISCAGIAVSYALWIFSGSFALLVFSRLLGGLMGANLSTATAVVADITTSKNRSRGMAIVGIAFGLGFIFGPAIGALLASIDLLAYFPDSAAYGINPFSMPAIFALILALINLKYVIAQYRETLPVEKRGKQPSLRSINPIRLFRTESIPGVSRNNLIYFLFLLAFSGMEFTLTFLAFERFDFSNMEQGLMFLYIGICLAFIQGGYVRRKAALIGEKKMAGRGLFLLIPGLVLIGISNSVFLLYLGLFFMALGSAQIVPCLTSLTSIYTPDKDQGRVLGVFRSLGSLSRAIGPLLACFLYWKMGAESFYISGALFLLLPIFLWRKLPDAKPA